MGDIRSPTQHDSLPMFGVEKTEKGKGRRIFWRKGREPKRGYFLEEGRNKRRGEERKPKIKIKTQNEGERGGHLAP